MTMNNEFVGTVEDRLEEALAMLAAGAPLADVLVEVGHDAGWLRPLLEVATETNELRLAIPLPPPEASLQRLLAYGESLAAAEVAVSPEESGWRARLRHFFGDGWGPRLAVGVTTGAMAISVLVAFLAGSVVGGGLALTAQDSLPGQSLYPIKRAGEAINLSLTNDPKERQTLLETYNERRLRETQLLLKEGEQARVAFNGQIEAVTETTVTIDGLVVQITPQTEIQGDLAKGAHIQVAAMTEPSGELVALSIIVIGPPPPTPTPTPTATLTATPLPTFTPTLLPTETPTPVLSKATDNLELEPTSAATSPPAPPAVEPDSTEEPADGEDQIEPEEPADNGSNDDGLEDNGDSSPGSSPESNENGGNDDTSNNEGSDNSGDNSGSDDQSSNRGGGEDHGHDSSGGDRSSDGGGSDEGGHDSGGGRD